MKKFIAGLAVGILSTLLVLFIWAMFSVSHNFLRCVVAKPPIEECLSHFGFAGDHCLPASSSKHYFFSKGFRKVDEYWSFDLSLENMEAFVSEYTGKRQMPKVTDQPPSQATHPLSSSFEEYYPEWQSGYWFSSLGELDEMYYKEKPGRGDFIAYSKANGRVYLINWDN